MTSIVGGGNRNMEEMGMVRDWRRVESPNVALPTPLPGLGLCVQTLGDWDADEVGGVGGFATKHRDSPVQYVGLFFFASLRNDGPPPHACVFASMFLLGKDRRFRI
jgi:hypothetical protein